MKKESKIDLRHAKLASLLLVFTVVACGAPKTAEEFRKAAPGAMFGKSKKLDVKRPYGQISKMLQRKASECMNGEVITTEGRPNGGSARVTNKVNTGVNITKQRTELITRYVMGGAIIGQPDEGYIMLVADAIPVDAKTTHLDFYYGAATRYVEAIETWAKGDEKGCPDMTRIMER